jgi:hypothetical protein
MKEETLHQEKGRRLPTAAWSARRLFDPHPKKE